MDHLSDNNPLPALLCRVRCGLRLHLTGSGWTRDLFYAARHVGPDAALCLLLVRPRADPRLLSQQGLCVEIVSSFSLVTDLTFSYRRQFRPKEYHFVQNLQKQLCDEGRSLV